jgi:hypothetical protein
VTGDGRREQRLVSDIAPALVAHRHERVERALRYLEAGFSEEDGFASWITDSVGFDERHRAPTEYFSTMIVTQLLLEAGQQPRVLDRVLDLVFASCNARGFVHFFSDHHLLAADIDCTGIGHALLLDAGRPHPAVDYVVKRLLRNVDPRGVIEVYEQPAPGRAGRIDPCALVNALHLVHRAGREAAARPSLDAVYEFLVSGAYERGTRYYPSGDTFLYFLSRLLRDFERTHERFLAPLHAQLTRRFGAPGTTLERATRVSAADNVGLFDREDLQQLVHDQRSDGSWPPGAFFKYGRATRFFGSEAVTTAFALRALVAGPRQHVSSTWLRASRS